MIVTCERCATQFQLDDARVPASGVRVRCSRCKHAFEIHKSAPAAAPAASDDEESDWQFNEDPPRGSGASGGGLSRGSAASVVDDLLGGGNAAAGAGDDELFGGSPSSGLELREAPPRAAPTPPSPGALAGAPVAGRPKPSAAPHRDASPIAMPEAGSSGLDLEGDPVRFSAPKPLMIAPDPDPVADLASELADELAIDSAAAPASAAPASDELSPADWDVLAGAEADLGSARRTPSIDPDALIDDRPRWQTGLERAGGWAGGLAVAVLFAFGLHGGLLPEPAVSLGPPVASEAGGVELREVSGRFVDHAEAGWIYVVSGRIENSGPRPIPAGSLALAVLDHQGRRLAPPAQAAAPLSAEAIREGRISGPWRHSPALRPGESRAFQAVLGPLPAGAQRLSLMSVESAVAGVSPDPTGPSDSATAAQGDAGPRADRVADVVGSSATATRPAAAGSPAPGAPPAAPSP